MSYTPYGIALGLFGSGKSCVPAFSGFPFGPRCRPPFLYPGVSPTNSSVFTVACTDNPYRSAGHAPSYATRDALSPPPPSRRTRPETTTPGVNLPRPIHHRRTTHARHPRHQRRPTPPPTGEPPPPTTAAAAHPTPTPGGPAPGPPLSNSVHRGEPDGVRGRGHRWTRALTCATFTAVGVVRSWRSPRRGENAQPPRFATSGTRVVTSLEVDV